MKTNTINILTGENFHEEVLCSRQPVLVEFTTDWCGTSHIMAPILKDLVIKFGADIKFCKIDIDDYNELAKEYNIEKIPTILLFKNGKIIDFIFGATSREMLSKKLTLLTSKGKEPL